MHSLRLLVRVFLGVLPLHSCRAARTWDYEPLSISSTTSDPSQVLISHKIDRIGRGEFAISGTMLFNYTTTENTMVEALVYRSSSGAEADYKLLPYAIPKQPLYQHLNTFYKDPPFPKITYVVDKCQLSEESGLPELTPSGFYKIVFKCYGENQPSWSFTAVFKIATKLF